MPTSRVKRSLESNAGKIGWVVFILGAIQPIRWLLEAVSDLLTLKTIWPTINSAIRTALALTQRPALSSLLLVSGIILIVRSMAGTRTASGNSIESAGASLARIPKNSDPNRIFLPPTQTPQFLMSLCKDKMSVEIDRSTQPYVGKWMCLSGRVKNVDSNEKDSIQIVRLSVRGSTLVNIICHFARDWHNRLEILTREQPVEVQGRIKRISLYDVTLDNCELVED